ARRERTSGRQGRAGPAGPDRQPGARRGPQPRHPRELLPTALRRQRAGRHAGRAGRRITAPDTDTEPPPSRTEMRIAPVCACALAVILSGVAHGLYTNRWQTAPDPREVQPRLDRLPAALGPWAARDVAVEAEALERGGIRAHLSREYRDARTGRSVRVLLV